MWQKRKTGTAPIAVLMGAVASVATVLVSAPRVWAHTTTPTLQPEMSDPDVRAAVIDPAADPQPSPDEMTKLVRDKIKYVFVIFNENESFDHEYGTLPGVNGLFSDGRKPRASDATPGFTQTYKDALTGEIVAVHPFRLGPEQNATFYDSVDHGHIGLAAKLHIVEGTSHMDGFAQDEYDDKTRVPRSRAQSVRGRQFANLVMSYVDCDTIPFLWRYASRFTIFDNIFATEDTPSTPNAIAMIAGQAGETQWVKHGAAGTSGLVSASPDGQLPYIGWRTATSIPVVNDPVPYWGSPFDQTSSGRAPPSPKENYGPEDKEVPNLLNVAPNLTFASVPLTSMGRNIGTILSTDNHPEANDVDIKRDIQVIAQSTPIAWRWYQNGYDLEPTDRGGVASHANFVAHHDGPQYFGYIADNAKERANLKGEGDLFADIEAHKLPKDGAVIYVRGGFGNLQHLKAPIQNPMFPRPLTPQDIEKIQATKTGDDDHPGYADRQISEAMAARVINAIASDETLWSQSAIIITYDESDGFYDHVPPRILSYGPDGLPLSRGIRVPLLVISPYARAHAVSHAEGDHNAIIETINAIFGLPALSSLPEEAEALKTGNSPAFNRFAPPGFAQESLGPRDTPSDASDSLLSAFEPKRLSGEVPILPASYVKINDADVTALPHDQGHGCARLGIVPEDVRQGIKSEVPPNFNTLPASLPQYNEPAP